MANQDSGSKTLEVLKVVLLPIAIAVVGGTLSWFQHQSAIEKQYLDRVASLLEDLASQDSAKKALAITYMNALAEDGKIEQEFAENLARVALEQALGERDELKVQNPAVARAIEKSFQSVRKQVIENLPTRVFLHIADESMRESARKLRDLLQEEGCLVPGIELVDAAPAETQLRFLNESDDVVAQAVESFLASEGYAIDVVDLSNRYEGTVQPKTLELWLAGPPESL